MRTFKTAALAALLMLGTAHVAQAQVARPILKIGVAKLPTGFDPGLNISNVGQRVNYSIFDELIRRAYWEGEKGDGAADAPSLATAWRNVSPLEWEVDIRTDVVFHNGAPMTAEDIAYSFSEERVWGESPIVAEGPTYFGNFTAVDVVDADTIKFTTEAPDPIFPKRFTTTMGKVVPKAYYTEVGVDEFNLHPIGTGPYKLEEFLPGEMIRLVSNDAYWGGLPPAQEVQYIEIPEEAARITGLLNGELDMITNVSPDQQSTLEASDAVTVYPAIIENSRVMTFNTLQAPIDNADLRRAMIYAVDREAIVEALWGGQSFVPHELDSPGHGADYQADRPQISYDPSEAKRLIEASGYKGEELVFRIHGGYYTNYEAMAEVMQQMWAAVGLNVKLDIRDGATLREGEYHMLAWSNGQQMADITHPMSNTYGPAAVRTRPDAKQFMWAAPARFHELVKLMETTLDHDQRIAYFNQALDIFEGEAPQMEMFQALEFYATRKGINWKPYSFWPMDIGPTNLSFSD